MADPLEELHAAIRSAAEALRDGAPESIAPTLERPPKPELGDYSPTPRCCCARPAASRPGRSPSGSARSSARLPASAERIEVAGPGFVNLFLADRWHRTSVAAMLAAGEGLGASSPQPERV